MALATLAEAKTFLGISGTDDDTLLTRLLDASTKFLENATGRTLEEATLTEYLDGDNDKTAFVKSPPVSFPTYGTNSWIKIDDVEIDEDELLVHAGEGRIVLDTLLFSKGVRNIEIKYLGGYASEGIPEDLKQACLELMATMFKRGKSAGVKSESIGDYSVTYTDKLSSPTVDMVIELYRIIFI